MSHREFKLPFITYVGTASFFVCVGAFIAYFVLKIVGLDNELYITISGVLGVLSGIVALFGLFGPNCPSCNGKIFNRPWKRGGASDIAFSRLWIVLKEGRCTCANCNALLRISKF
jgi:hypothetical protein